MGLFYFVMMFVDDVLCFCKPEVINGTERSTLPACSSFIVIVHEGNTESTIFRLKHVFLWLFLCTSNYMLNAHLCDM